MLYKAVDRWTDGKLTVYLVIFIHVRDKNRRLLINRLSNWSKDGGRRTRVHGNSRDRDTKAGSCPDRQRRFPHAAQESAEVLGKMGMCADFMVALKNLSIVSATGDVD